MKRAFCLLILLVLLLGPVEKPVALATAGITIDNQLASGFNRPVQLTHAGDGSGRMFVVEKPGRILIIQGGSVLAAPFLDITPLVRSDCSECGLLGVAFHPDYEQNGYFYINYNDYSSPMNTIIARYTVSGADPNAADPASAKVLLTVAQPYTNHNGGQLLFGADGYLYIGMGDGGSGGDPQNNAQNIESLLGKMLRLDVDSGDPYAIPPGNPLVGKPGRDEIWALGLRNPWRFSFDRLTGDLYVGDVGQNLWEEIDFQAVTAPNGVNFGWRCMEGSHLYNSLPPCNDPVFLSLLTGPIAEYPHTEGVSVTGGFVYRGSKFPDLYGRYFFADYGRGKIWSLTRLQESPALFSSPVLELSNTGIYISAFGEDEAGELYVLDFFGGTIRKLESTAGPGVNLGSSTFAPSTPSADVGESVTFTLLLQNSGGAAASASLTNPIPTALSYVPDSVTASSGTASYNSAAGQIEWSGSVPAAASVTISYQATVDSGVLGSVTSHAVLSVAGAADILLDTYISVPRPVLQTTPGNLVLPGTQPNQLNQGLQTSVDCDICHSAPIYDLWRGSAMSQAGRDPLMWAALTVANAYVPNAGEYCLRCHTPRGWLAGRSQMPDGSSLYADDIHNGVACLTCHRMVDPVPSSSDEAAGIDQLVRAGLSNPPPDDGTVGSAMMIIDPNDNRRGPFDLPATFGYHTAYQTDFLGRNAEVVGRARVCGTCHNLSNPLLEKDPGHGNQYWPVDPGGSAQPFAQQELFPVERTFDEWRLSAYAAGPAAKTCQDCHMPDTSGKAADDAFNPISRDCQTTGCLAQHALMGSNTWLPVLLEMPEWRLNGQTDSAYMDNNLELTKGLLRSAASMKLELGEPAAATRTLEVTIYNQTGHKLPTGYPEGRRMWIHVRAYNAAGDLVFESGAYDSIHAELAASPEPKVYEARLGMTPELSAYLGLPNEADGSSFFFVLNNTFVKDNRIPPRGYDAAAFDQDGLRPVMDDPYPSGQYWDTTAYTLPANAERVAVSLYYQVAAREYIEFLKQYGGLDGEALYAMWENSKSPPYLMLVANYPAYPVYIPMVAR